MFLIKPQLRIIYPFAILLLITGSFFLFRDKLLFRQKNPTSSNNNSEVILYYGINCSYCRNIEKWLEANPKYKEKSGLIEKETSQNQNNAREVLQKATDCRLDTSAGVQVPFLYDHGQCYVGEQAITKHFEEKYP